MKVAFILFLSAVCYCTYSIDFRLKSLQRVHKLCLEVVVVTATAVTITILPGGVHADDLGASDPTNAKIFAGGASTLFQGSAKSITRGVNLDRSNFSKQNLKGVAFQQSIVRDSNFEGADLSSASFFGATCDGSNFDDANLTLANLELAQFNRASFKNTIIREAYVVGNTRFDGVTSIENSDWTDTELSSYQRKYLCGLPSAKGVNIKTGANTRESLLCE